MPRARFGKVMANLPRGIAQAGGQPPPDDVSNGFGWIRGVDAGPRLLRRAVVQLDAKLSHCHGVREFTLNPRCMLRYAPMASPANISLSDGVRVGRGQLVLDLHLWNTHIPPVPDGGP